MPRCSRVLAAAAVSFTLIGCATTSRPRVELPPAPDDTAALEDRSTYYKRYSSDEYNGDHLFLHDGIRVYHPADLLPAVDPSSPTARAVADYEAAREEVESVEFFYATGNAAATLGGLVALAGLVCLVGAVGIPLLGLSFAPNVGIGGADLQVLTTGALIGSGAITVIGLAVMTFALGVILVLNTVFADDRVEMSEAADRAARTYNQSLSDRLQVGVDADGIIIDLRRHETILRRRPTEDPGQLDPDLE